MVEFTADYFRQSLFVKDNCGRFNFLPSTALSAQKSGDARAGEIDVTPRNFSRTMEGSGADVVTIERPGTSDEYRAFGPFLPSGASGFFASRNRAKSIVVFNHQYFADRETFLPLACRADVLVENLRRGKNWPDVLRQTNAPLLFASASISARPGSI